MNKPIETRIEDLFKWSGELIITDDMDNVIEVLYQRVIGDADMQKARVAALRDSRLLRQALQDPTSDEALANLPLKGEVEQEEMVSTIILSRYHRYRAQAELRVQERKVKELRSDADLEEQEEYIADVEAAELEYEGRLTEEMHKLAEKDRERLMAMDYNELLDIHKEELIKFLCSVKMMATFDQMSAYLGTYEDQEFKQRRFRSFDEFDNLATPVKDLIVRKYKQLVMDAEDLKK